MGKVYQNKFYMNNFVKVIVSLILLFSLTGCIPVEDVQGIWKAGTADDNLIGSWKITQDGMSAFYEITKADSHLVIKQHNIYEQTIPSFKFTAKSFDLGKQKALLISLEDYIRQYKEQSRKWNGYDVDMSDYNVKFGILIYRSSSNNIEVMTLNPEDISSIITSVKTVDGMPVIESLSKETLTELKALISKPSNVLEKSRFIKIDNLEEELEQAKKESFNYNPSVIPKKCKLKVYGKQSKPLDNCIILVYEGNDITSNIYDAKNLKFLTSGKTDSEGIYELELNQFNTIAFMFHEGHAIGIVNMDSFDAEAEKNIILKESEVLGCNVLTVDGNRISGADITVLVKDNKLWDAYYDITSLVPGLKDIINKDGFFEVPMLSSDNDILVIVDKEGYAKTYGATYPIKTSDYKLNLGSKYYSQNKIYLKEYGGANIKLVDRFTKQPISDVPLYADVYQPEFDIYQRYTEITNFDGVVNFDKFPPVSFVFTSDNYWFEGPHSLPIQSGQTIEDVVIYATPLKPVEVKVINDNREPVNDMKLTFTSKSDFKDEPFFNFFTNSFTNNTNVVSALLPINKTVKIEAVKSGFEPKVVTVNTESNLRLIEIIYDRDTVKRETEQTHNYIGKIHFPSGYEPAQTDIEVLTDMAGTDLLKTDKNGVFKLPKYLFENHNFSYFLIARCVKHNLAGFKEIVSFDKPLEITLEPAADISGTVFDDKGKPVADAEVTIRTLSGNFVIKTYAFERIYDKVTTDENGDYHIEGVLADKGISVVVRKEKYGIGSEFIDNLVSGTNNSLEDIILESLTESVAGKVVNQRGEAKNGWIVQSGYGSTETDKEGRFELDDIPVSDKVWLRYYAPGQINYAESTYVKSGDRDIVLKCTEREIETPYVLFNGKWVKHDYSNDGENFTFKIIERKSKQAVPGVKVLLESVDRTNYFDFFTDNNGEAALHLPGNFALYYTVNDVSKQGFECKSIGKSIRFSNSELIIYVMQNAYFANLYLYDEHGNPVEKAFITYTVRKKGRSGSVSVKNEYLKKCGNPEYLELVLEPNNDNPQYIYEIFAKTKGGYFACSNEPLSPDMDIELYLSRGVEVRCKMVGPSGESVEDGTFILRKQGYGDFSSKFADGFFRSKKVLPKNTYFEAMFINKHYKLAEPLEVIIPQDATDVFDLGIIQLKLKE